jgi:hypothetical protein
MYKSIFQLYAMDGVYAGNAGAFSCHLLGKVKNATNICEKSRRTLLRYRFC